MEDNADPPTRTAIAENLNVDEVDMQPDDPLKSDNKDTYEPEHECRITPDTDSIPEAMFGESQEDVPTCVTINEESTSSAISEQSKDVSTTPKDIQLSALCEMRLGTGTFFKGCKWAPDGLCLMSCSNDNVIRLINTPRDILEQTWQNFTCNVELVSCLDVKEAEIIYDYAWWPHMNSMYPNTCCFVTTAKDQPVHLWDAFTGKLRASYIAKDHVDEVSAAHCVGFSPDGMQVICGFSKCLRLFYIDKPGTSCETWPTRKHKAATRQRGIISTCEFSPDGNTIACGSYDGSVGLYSSKNGDLIGLLQSNNKGVTQVQFSQDGNRLYSGSRMDNSIICWDIRHTARDLFHISRKVDTNQRIYFDIGSRSCPKKDSSSEEILISGSTDGGILFWDIQKSQNVDNGTDIEPFLNYRANKDCVNGVSIHPFLPILATSSGQRHYSSYSYNDSSDSDGSEIEIEENCLQLWHLANWKI